MNDETLNNLLAKANECINTGNFDEAETLANELLAELEKISESGDTVIAKQRDTIHCEALITLSIAKWRRGDFHTALTHARAALDFAEEKYLPDETNAKALGTIGIVYQYLSEYPQALTYYQKALAIYEEIGNKKGTGGTMVNIGIVYGALGQNAIALEYYEKALPIFDEIGEKLFKANALTSIGDVYQNLLDSPQALTYFQKALAIYEEIGIKHGIATNLGNIGIVFANLSDYPQALTYFQKALAIYEEIGSKNGIASNLGNIGIVFANLSDYPQALTYLQKALAIYEEIGSKNGIASNLGNIGGLYADKEFDGYDPAKAEEMMLKAMAIDEEIGEKLHLYHVHKSLADLYKVEKRWEECQMHYEKFYTLEKEVQSEDAHKQANLMEQRRQAAEREKEIAIAHAAASARHEATVQLLHNVLPPSIADKMLDGTKLIAEKIPSVSVLFADIVNFTKFSQRITPEDLVEGLDRIFSEFDALAEKYGLEKIKTIGDAYMVVSGAPVQRDNHAEAMAHFALEMVEAMKEFRSISTGEEIQLRIGIHSGEVVAGVIGKKKFAYDLWGDAVNTASRMESHGEPGKIHVSEEFMNAFFERTGPGLSLPSPMSLRFAERGKMEIKGKGLMKTYFLE
ncbi:MAG: tetratricopeptide repeat protein [Ignavibacteria bacterium]|nr:tetratricopeptide repeat protein [Ignavibacteria bacterium]